MAKPKPIIKGSKTTIRKYLVLALMLTITKKYPDLNTSLEAAREARKKLSESERFTLMLSLKAREPSHHPVIDHLRAWLEQTRLAMFEEEREVRPRQFAIDAETCEITKTSLRTYARHTDLLYLAYEFMQYDPNTTLPKLANSVIDFSKDPELKAFLNEKHLNWIAAKVVKNLVDEENGLSLSNSNSYEQSSQSVVQFAIKKFEEQTDLFFTKRLGKRAIKKPK